jgi:hypothetical protein
MDLQYLSDAQGRHTAVVIPIEDWNNITIKHEDLRALESPYKPEFVAKIEESKEQAKNGKVTRVEKENLKVFLGL